MLFRRFVRRDLRANAYVSIAQRIILAVVGVWAVLQVSGIPGAVFGEGAAGSEQSKMLLTVGFVVGAFPPLAWQVLRAAFQKNSYAEVLVPSLQSPMPLRDLDGLTVWHEGRLEEEDIENVQNMSTANIVELMLNTRYPADRIIDWVDQAMLYTQIGRKPSGADPDSIELLKSFGIRTASALVAASLSKVDTNPAGTAQSIDDLLGKAEGGACRIPLIVATLQTNPNLELIHNWNSTQNMAKVVAAGPAN